MVFLQNGRCTCSSPKKTGSLLKQPRQRRRQKTINFMTKQQLFTCIALFSIFPQRPMHDHYTKPPDATFYVGRDLGVERQDILAHCV